MAASHEHGLLSTLKEGPNVLLTEDAADHSAVQLAGDGDFNLDMNKIQSEHDLSLWTYNVEGELIEASLDEYK